MNRKNKVIERFLDKYKVKTVLDMTCGTGAQVLHLVEQGYKVTGSDFSPGLLERARDKASKQNIKVKFVNGDMRDLQLGEFDAVITIDNAIGHLVKADFDIAIRNIYKNLKKGGLYIFDILNLNAMTDEVIDADSKKVSDSRVTTDGTTICKVRNATIDRVNGYLSSEETITIKKNEQEKKIKNRCSLQIYTMDELKTLLSKNSFETIEQHKIDTYSFHQDDEGYGILTDARKQ